MSAEELLDLRARARSDLPDHRAAAADEDLLLRFRLDEDVGGDRLVRDLLDLNRESVWDFVAREGERLLADRARDLRLDRQVRALLRREIERPFAEEPDELVAELGDAVARLRADRMQRVEVAEPRRRAHLRRDVARLQPVDLVQRDHDGRAEREDALRDEPVAGADAFACAEDEQHAVHVVERAVDRALHVLGERVLRTLEAGQVGEHELVVVARQDPVDAAPRRLGLVRDDRDLAAAKRVDERRLADVRAARHGDEAAPHDESFWTARR